MTQVGQGTLDAVIAPAGILLGDTHHEIVNFPRNRRASRLLSPTVAVVPLSSHQELMPAQDGVGSEESADLIEELATQDFPFDGQPAALVVVEQDSSFSELLSEYLVLGPEIINGLLLLVIDPCGEDEMEQLPRLKNKGHGGPVAVKEMA